MKKLFILGLAALLTLAAGCGEKAPALQRYLLYHSFAEMSSNFFRFSLFFENRSGTFQNKVTFAFCLC